MEDDTRAKKSSTTIGHTIVIRGKLKSDEDLIVHGRIDAEISSAKSVLIEKAGIVKAGVRAESLSVSGILVGNAQAASRMEISSGGRMVGDILSPKIVISDGAAFRGQIDMQTFEQPRVVTNGSAKNGHSVPPMAPAAEPAPMAEVPVPVAFEAVANPAPTAFGDELRPPPMTTAQEPPKPPDPEPEEDDSYAMLGLNRKGRKKKGLF